MGKTVSIYLNERELKELEAIHTYYKNMLPDLSKSDIIGACIHWFFEEKNQMKHKN